MKEESEMVSERDEDREDEFMDLRFRKVIVRFCFSKGEGVSMWKVMARWSDTGL